MHDQQCTLWQVSEHSIIIIPFKYIITINFETTICIDKNLQRNNGNMKGYIIIIGFIIFILLCNRMIINNGMWS